jgi:hypothetical protein
MVTKLPCCLLINVPAAAAAAAGFAFVYASLPVVCLLCAAGGP